jgi:hypothetical protein
MRSSSNDEEAQNLLYQLNSMLEPRLETGGSGQQFKISAEKLSQLP